MAGPSSGWALGFGLALGSPALWAALVDGSLPLQTALLKVGVAVLVAWVGLALLQGLLAGTAEPAPPQIEPRRALPGIDGPVPVRPASLDPVEPVQVSESPELTPPVG